jgi:AraC-like DNA-binding protein
MTATDTWRNPRPQLAPLMARPMLAYEMDDADFASWLMAATSVVTLIIELDGGLRIGGEQLPHSFVTGLDDGPTVVAFDAPYRGVELKLTPLGARRILGWPMAELSGNVIDIGDLFGRNGAELTERLSDAGDWDRCFDLVEEFVACRADGAPAPSPVVARALARLRETEGRIRVGELAAELNCSRRHLGALFANEVGLTPKTMARVLRFEALSRRLDDDPAAWADIAADCGYADQPHLNREVRALAGVSPSELVARRIPSGRVGDDLPFVQDRTRGARLAFAP